MVKIGLQLKAFLENVTWLEVEDEEFRLGTEPSHCRNYIWWK